MENTLEVQEVSLEKVIETKLVQNNVTDQVLNALKKKYGGLKLSSIDDKEGYLTIKEARKEVRKVGVITEKLCKQGREEAVAIQKKWLAKEKEILGKIAIVQDPLDSEIKRFEDEVERKEQEEANRKEQAYMQRQTTLLKMEAKYDNNSFTLGNVSYEISNIRDAEDEVWEDTILPKYQREFAKVEAERAEQERIKKEAEDKLKEDQAELQRQQNELNAQREEMRLMQEQLQKQKDDADRIIKERALEEQREAERVYTELQRTRFEALFPYNPYGADVDMATLWALTESHFNEVLTDKKELFEKEKLEQEKLAEEKRLADIEQAKQDTIKQEQERIAEENRLIEAKRQQEEQQRHEEAAKASDKDKWSALVQQFNAIILPEFKSSVYKSRLSILKEKIEEIQNL